MTVKDLDDDTLLQNMHLYNDQDAFTILFRRHWKPLYKTILAKTGDVEQADDIVQEIFVQLWERRDKINRIISLKGYLNGIAYNKVIDFYRYTKKQEDTLALLGRQAASVVSEDFITDVIRERASQEESFEEAVGKLPAAMREIYLLRARNGCSYEEIGDLLKIKPKTARDKYSKAIVRLYEITGNLSIALLLSYLL